jgi:hypothetical protein
MSQLVTERTLVRDHFRQFLGTVCDALRDKPEAEGVYFVLDECSIHAEEDLEGTGYPCKFLPPHSRKLSISQPTFTFLKEDVKRLFRTSCQDRLQAVEKSKDWSFKTVSRTGILGEAIRDSIKSVTPNLLKNFSH